MSNVRNMDASVADGCPYLRDYQPLSPEELRDPYPTFRWARENAPVFYSDVSHTPGRGMWSVARHADILEIVKDTVTYSNAGQRSPAKPPAEVRHRMADYPWSETVLTLDGDDHREARRILQSPFAFRQIKSRDPLVRRIMGDLIDGFRANARVEFVHEVGYPLSLATISETIGFPRDSFNDLKRWVEVSFAVLGNAIQDEHEMSDAIEHVVEFHEFIVGLVRDRMRNPVDDYLSIMVQTADEEGASPSIDRMVRSVFTLIIAGFETTAQAMSLGIWQLLENREQWKMLLDDRSLVPGAVEEMLRYRSMVQRLFRTTTREVEIADVTIPEGALVAALTSSAHRDPDAFENADEFDITRKRNPHFAFGKGAHLCVGAPLARLEFTVMLETMLDLFPGLRIADGFTAEWSPDIRMAVLRELPLVW